MEDLGSIESGEGSLHGNLVGRQIIVTSKVLKETKTNNKFGFQSTLID